MPVAPIATCFTACACNQSGSNNSPRTDGRELGDVLHSLAAPAGNAHARGHLRLVHVQAGGTLNDRLHDLSSRTT